MEVTYYAAESRRETAGSLPDGLAYGLQPKDRVFAMAHETSVHVEVLSKQFTVTAQGVVTLYLIVREI